MGRKQLIPQKLVTYFFINSKDVNVEDGLSFVTRFARLVREIISFRDGKKQTLTEIFWVQIDDIQMEYVTEKVKTLPNCIQTYEVSEKVFGHLLQLSKCCPNELYGITPYYLKANREVFLTWQELEQSWENNCREKLSINIHENKINLIT